MAEIIRREVQSDPSGVIVPEQEAWRANVLHPELGTEVRQDLTADDAEAFRKLSAPAVRVVMFAPGEGGAAEELSIPVAKFDSLYRGVGKKAMEVLAEAPVVEKKRSHSNGNGNHEQRDYATMEWAGSPKKGLTSEPEKAFVRNNFRAVNARLKGDGMRTIDLGNADMVKRYGLELLAEAAKANGGVLPEGLGGEEPRAEAPAVPEQPQLA